MGDGAFVAQSLAAAKAVVVNAKAPHPGKVFAVDAVHMMAVFHVHRDGAFVAACVEGPHLVAWCGQVLYWYHSKRLSGRAAALAVGPDPDAHRGGGHAIGGAHETLRERPSKV